MIRSFGVLLREYRNKSIDPETGRRLSQGRLASLIGESLGTTYSAQAISDWERDKSQIHKDHRQVLNALIQTLHRCGGLNSLEDAEKLLAAGNYRSLSHAEAESIFLLTESDSPKATPAQWPEQFKANFFQGTTASPFLLTLKTTSIVFCWLATWMAVSPVLCLSDKNPEFLLNQSITLTITGLAVPTVTAWTVSLNPGRNDTLPIRSLNFIGSTLGFCLGLTNILMLAILSYNLYLYPWPTAVILIISLWPVALSLICAELIQAQLQSTKGEIRLRDIKLRWAILCLPLLIGLGLYHFHYLSSARLLGPLLLLTLSLGLGVLLWSLTREAS